ncbi:unnamed protein product [Boreogadus saida]
MRPDGSVEVRITSQCQLEASQESTEGEYENLFLPATSFVYASCGPAIMGSKQSSHTFHCNEFLNGKGPPALITQANEEMNIRYKELRRVQPDGQMTWVILHRDLPGYHSDNTLQISFIFPDGVQTESHPNPGKPFAGLRQWAYLPDNREGRKVLQLLDKGFSRGLIFTVATNEEGVDIVSPADVPLKTQPDGGTSKTSYPDPDYLKIVRKILKDKDIE